MSTAIRHTTTPMRAPRPAFRLGLLSVGLLLLAIFTLNGPAMAAAEDPCPSRCAEVDQGEFWVVDTRCAPRCSPGAEGNSRIVFQREEECRWANAERADWLAAVRGRPLVIVAHGNWTGRGDALAMFRSVKRVVGAASDGRPYVLTGWSWPSDRSRGRIKPDLLRKARYSDTQSFYLADLLREVDPATPVTLVGYSYGARAIGGALHMLAGGRVAGMALDRPAPPREARLGVVLAAAAMHAHWFGPGQRHGLALEIADGMDIAINPCDPVLKRYPRLFGSGRCGGLLRRGAGSGPEALGYRGPTCLDAGQRDRVTVFNVSCPVGRNHGWYDYFRSARLRQSVCRWTFDGPTFDGPTFDGIANEQHAAAGVE